MSRIYEALRKHEQQQTAHQPRPQPRLLAGIGAIPPEPMRGPLAGEREMRALHHSLDSALGPVEGAPIIMFASAHPGEGKSTVAGGFAGMLARHLGRSVAVLDGDRRRVLSRRFAPVEPLAPTEVAQGVDAMLREAKRAAARGGVAVVNLAAPLAGGGEVHAAELFAGLRQGLRKAFDYVVVDMPSLAELPWGAALARHADGVVLVVEAERTRWPVALRAREELEGAGGKVLGVFLNRRRYYVPEVVYRYL
jgi:protein-tyrosine kinase